MSRLPKNTRKQLKDEAIAWEKAIAKESPQQVEELLNKAEPFNIPRPARQPVSIRMDPFDLSMAKRLARKRGIPYTQLMAAWLHERIAREKDGALK